MESQSSCDLEDLISTPRDVGLPSPPPPPPPPYHMESDPSRPAVVVELEAWGWGGLPAMSSTPADVELVEKHLYPAVTRLNESSDRGELVLNYPVVNAGLPEMNPCELPGVMPHNEDGRKEKYYLTIHPDLYFARVGDLGASGGIWKEKCMSAVSASGISGICGMKKTYVFYSMGTKTNWIMNAFSSIDNHYDSNKVDEDYGLVLCHVFEEDLPGYDSNHKCPTFHQANCKGSHSNPSIHAPSNSPSDPTFHQANRKGNDSRCNPMIHPPSSNTCLDQTAPEVTSYIAMLQNVLLGDPDTDTEYCCKTENRSPGSGVPPHGDVDAGQPKRKRKKKTGSDVWDYFTKIHARGRNGEELKLAVCNHCLKVLTGDSKGGTSHLARHTCPCKLQPVQAGRKDQGGLQPVLPPAGRKDHGDVNIVSRPEHGQPDGRKLLGPISPTFDHKARPKARHRPRGLPRA